MADRYDASFHRLVGCTKYTRTAASEAAISTTNVRIGEVSFFKEIPSRIAGSSAARP